MIQEIAGEYKRVARLSNEKDLMIKAHQTPCTQQEAESIIRRYADAYDLKIPYIKFKPYHNGRATKQSGIILPANGDNIEVSPYGKLRIGIVLHELAHIFCKQKISFSYKHDRDFVDTFDTLLYKYYYGSGYDKGTVYETL
jgi:hypothetical protein